MATWNGHKDVVHELILAKANVNVRNEQGIGALHLAASKGFDDILLELLGASAAPDMQDKVCQTQHNSCTA